MPPTSSVRCAPGPTRRGVSELTEREREVWALLAEGLTNVQIAARPSLSENTVKFHVHHLYRKLGVKHRTEVALGHASPGRPPSAPRR